MLFYAIRTLAPFGLEGFYGVSGLFHRARQAQINYQLAVAALQKAMNTIVSANDIELARPPSRGAAAPATRK
jgi:hypothetical protein